MKLVTLSIVIATLACGSANAAVEKRSLVCSLTAGGILANLEAGAVETHVRSAPAELTEIRINMKEGPAVLEFSQTLNGAEEVKTFDLQCGETFEWVECRGNAPNALEGGTESVSFSYNPATAKHFYLQSHYLPDIRNGTAVVYAGECASH